MLIPLQVNTKYVSISSYNIMIQLQYLVTTFLYKDSIANITTLVTTVFSEITARMISGTGPMARARKP
jgi:hypothetical protein